MVKITEVEAGSRAEKHGILPGDALVSVNDNPITDVLDYRFYLAEPSVSLRLSRAGEEYTAVIRKGEYDDIGLTFETPLMDRKRSCKNGCIFCFIDQNPDGMRESIYFKDDDSRLSFIHGNYITLTNMTDADVERIVKMRFSPINVSIHTTNPDLRVKMMKNRRAGEVLRYLRILADAGITLCGQIVLCRGVNDGEELLRTMRDLSAYLPALSSVSVVPAGLTKHRDGLYPLTDFTPDEAKAVIDAVTAFGNEMLALHGTRLFFVADEFYLKAGLPLPDEEYYEGYPQIENGVGMLRSFASDFDFELEDLPSLLKNVKLPRRVTVVTGKAAAPMLSSLAQKLCSLVDGLSVKVIPIRNDFFGESVTVAGLLTGTDILHQLEGVDPGDELLLPAVCLRRGEEDFLCGMTLASFKQKIAVPVRVAGEDGCSFLHACLGME